MGESSKGATGFARLAVDRSFVLSGAGVVVTGTVHAGEIRVDDRLLLSPSGLEARVRSLHAQNRAAEIGRAGEDYGFDGIAFVDDPREAEVILILGSNAPATSLDDYRAMLEGLTLPAICCNPDKLMLSPKLYASFLLWLLSELFENLPEAGDLDQPKLVFFFDEAHLLFADAPKVASAH